MEDLIVFCIAPLACVLIVSALMYGIKKLIGVNLSHDKTFFAKRPVDYLWGKPPDKYERRAMRSNSRMRR